MNRVFLTSFLAICCASAASASTIFNLADVAGTTAVAGSINTTTTGASMAGQMTVSINGGAAVGWTTDVGGCTSVNGCGQASAGLGNGSWTLSLTGNPGSVTNPSLPEATALNFWTLTSTSTNVAITSVALHGVLSNSCFAGNPNPAGCIPGIVFDRDSVTGTGANSLGQEGTPGSNFGISYTFNSESGPNSPYSAGVTYSDVIALGGAAQTCNGAAFSANNTATGCGDLWGTLTFTFIGGSFQAGAGGNAVWSFFQDTDSTAIDAAVPEPSTLGLLGAGLLALAALRQRKSYKANRRVA